MIDDLSSSAAGSDKILRIFLSHFGSYLCAFPMKFLKALIKLSSLMTENWF